MLVTHANRSVCFFAIDYPPDFGDGVMRAANSVQKQFKAEVASLRAPFNYVFRWPNERILMTVANQRLAFAMLNFATWCDQKSKHLSMIHAALNEIKPETLKRVGFKVVAWLPLEMSHAELCELFIGSLTASRDKLEPVYGDSLDPLLQMQGEMEGLRYLSVVTPMNQTQASSQLKSLAEFPQLFGDPRTDAGQSDFHERVASEDCLSFDIDLYQEDVAPDGVDRFLRESIGVSKRIADNVVNQVLAKPIVDEKG